MGDPACLVGAEEGTDAKREGPSHGSDGPSAFDLPGYALLYLAGLGFPSRLPGALRPQEHAGATVCAQRRAEGSPIAPTPVRTAAPRIVFKLKPKARSKPL